MRDFATAKWLSSVWTIGFTCYSLCIIYYSESALMTPGTFAQNFLAVAPVFAANLAVCLGYLFQSQRRRRFVERQENVKFGAIAVVLTVLANILIVYNVGTVAIRDLRGISDVGIIHHGLDASKAIGWTLTGILMPVYLYYMGRQLWGLNLNVVKNA